MTRQLHSQRGRMAPILGEKITVRIKGIDTRELRGKCESEVRQAREAKQFTVAKLRESKTIRLSGIERDKYFRILTDVDLDGVDLGQKRGHPQLFH